MTKPLNRCAVCGAPMTSASGMYAVIERRVRNDEGQRKVRSVFTARLCSVCGGKFADRCEGLLEGMRA